MIKASKKPVIALSGANGFVGGGVIRFLSHQSVDLHVIHRRPWNKQEDWIHTHHLPDMGDNMKAVAQAAHGADAFIHLAGRAHTKGMKKDYETSVVQLTQTLVQAAIKAKVKRFVYASTILVHGMTTNGIALTEESEPKPENWYAESKSYAENVVIEACEESGMEYTIVRPPLVYGPNCKGNLRKLANLIQTGFPLPFGGIDNKRSLISLDNLASLLWQCALDDRAANQIYVACDGQDLSTPDIIRLIAKGMGKKPHLFSVPDSLLQAALRMAGKQKMIDQLMGSLQIDNTKVRNQLGWSPLKPPSVALPDAVKDTMK